ncbi:hypothetical protein BDV93DRAFT_547405 [Ceratobasidium sp. AG-I]|nr:hypothetical protein BDV93DRAFT_547405 [Ceratobasidium sp. AG-I]
MWVANHELIHRDILGLVLQFSAKQLQNFIKRCASQLSTRLRFRRLSPSTTRESNPTMADANREYVVTYVVVGPGNVAPRCLSFNQEQRPGLVVHLGMLLRQAEGWDANTQYDLYKADFTEQELQGLRDNVLPSMDRTTKLHGLDVVDKCWPEGFAKTELDLVVELKSDAPPLESSRKGFRAGREYYERAAPEQLRALSAIGGNRSSSLAIPSNFKKHQASKGALYNGRPQSRAGPPIGLYCPVFDSFVAGLDPTLDITSVQLQGTIDLLKRSQSQYPTELKVSGRTAAVFPGLDLLLEAKLVVREGAGIKADGIISALNGAPLLVAELKNEVGQGGADPSIQGAIAFAMYWNNPNLDDIRPASCCPSFILAIAGPWMCVLGAILLDHPVVQRLTDYVWVGDDSKPATHLNVCKLARMFASLSSSVKTLDDFYRGLKCNKKDKTRFYPYLRHFEVNGQRMEFQYNESVSLDKLVFEASMGSKTDERTIIVKFAESYHVEAHQLLANAGLAPALLLPVAS